MTLSPLPALVREIENCITARHLDAALALCSNLRAAIAAVPANAEEWLRGRFGAARGHAEWRMLTEAFNAGKATAAPDAAVPAQPVAFRVRLDGMWFHGADREGLIAAIGVKLGRSISEQEVEPLYAAPQAVPVPAGWSVTYDGKRASYIYADQETAEFEAQQVGGTARAVAVYLASAPKEQP